jgi:hypothetical protein
MLVAQHLYLNACADQYTDELFASHEAYVAELRSEVEELKPLLRLVEKRDELKADKAEYETIISDPSRLLVKGSSAA